MEHEFQFETLHIFVPHDLQEYCFYILSIPCLHTCPITFTLMCSKVHTIFFWSRDCASLAPLTTNMYAHHKHRHTSFSLQFVLADPILYVYTGLDRLFRTADRERSSF